MIVVVLWTITLMTILVAVIASQTRLSAEVAWIHKQDLALWAAQQSAINQAEMELMMENMPLPAKQQQEKMDNSAASLNETQKNPRYRYNGQSIDLAYKQNDNIEVRIFEHGGKINLREINAARMRALLEKKLGGAGKANQEQLDNLMDAWSDWLDLNDGKNPRGAEKDYYLALDTPFIPRNGALETVEEILNVRGFADVLGDVDLDAAFTLYGEDELVNLNTATVEAMRLLPGLNEELIGKIVAWRKDHEFQGNGDVAQLLPAENMTELRPWISIRKTTNYYTIMVTTRPENVASDQPPPETKESDIPQEDEDRHTFRTAFAEIVYASSASERPQVLKINPYQKLPIDPDTLIPPEGSTQ